MIAFYLTEQALREYKSMSAGEQDDLDAIYKRLRERFKSTGFKMIQQGRLMNATQKEDEGIDDFIERFERLADSIDTEPQQKLALFTRNAKKEIREVLITFGAGSTQEAYNRPRLKEASMMEREDKGATDTEPPKDKTSLETSMKQVQKKIADSPAEETTIAAVNSYMEKNWPRNSSNNGRENQTFRLPNAQSGERFSKLKPNTYWDKYK